MSLSSSAVASSNVTEYCSIKVYIFYQSLQLFLGKGIVSISLVIPPFAISFCLFLLIAKYCLVVFKVSEERAPQPVHLQLWIYPYPYSFLSRHGTSPLLWERRRQERSLDPWGRWKANLVYSDAWPWKLEISSQTCWYTRFFLSDLTLMAPDVSSFNFN